MYTCLSLYAHHTQRGRRGTSRIKDGRGTGNGCKHRQCQNDALLYTPKVYCMTGIVVLANHLSTLAIKGGGPGIQVPIQWVWSYPWLHETWSRKINAYKINRYIYKKALSVHDLYGREQHFFWRKSCFCSRGSLFNSPQIRWHFWHCFVIVSIP